MHYYYYILLICEYLCSASTSDSAQSIIRNGRSHLTLIKTLVTESLDLIAVIPTLTLIADTHTVRTKLIKVAPLTVERKYFLFAKRRLANFNLNLNYAEYDNQRDVHDNLPDLRQMRLLSHDRNILLKFPPTQHSPMSNRNRAMHELSLRLWMGQLFENDNGMEL